MADFSDIVRDVCSGVVVGSSHGFWFAQDFLKTRVLRPTLGLLGVKLSARNRNKSGTLKVIGVGYGRTGTYSLALALEDLGYPTLHTQHMYESRDILDMWTSSVFQPSIEANEASLMSPDFDLIVQHGFTATMDLPTALYFEQIMDQYPESKFILTTRATSDIWFNSWNMLTKAITVPTHRFGFLWHAKKLNMYYRWLFSMINNDEYFLTVPLPLPAQDKDKAIASYEAHNARVREIIPSDRLLEYSVKDGWEPLCKFLDVANCPTDKPFPKSNSALSVKVQTVSAMVVPISLVLLVVSVIVKRIRVPRGRGKKSKMS